MRKGPTVRMVLGEFCFRQLALDPALSPTIDACACLVRRGNGHGTLER